MAAQKKSTLIGVDTNVLYNLADEDEDTIDAIATIRARIPHPEFIIPLTVGHETANEIKRKGPSKELALIAGQNAVPVWGFKVSMLTGVPNGIAERIGQDLRNKGMIPDEERNDGLIIGEAAVEGMEILLTNDAHLLDMDWDRADRLVREYGYKLPLIARPRKIVEMFFKSSS